MSSEEHLVFVYGTLRRGASNAFRLEGAEFVREGEVRGRLYRIDWYPGVVLDPQGGRVRGEIWRVSADMLGELDEFEGLAPGETTSDEYRRVMAEVLDPRVGASAAAWIWEWMGAIPDSGWIESGDWLEPR